MPEPFLDGLVRHSMLDPEGVAGVIIESCKDLGDTTCCCCCCCCCGCCGCCGWLLGLFASDEVVVKDPALAIPPIATEFKPSPPPKEGDLKLPRVRLSLLVSPKGLSELAVTKDSP